MQPSPQELILALLLLLNLILTAALFRQLRQYRKKQHALLEGEDGARLADIVRRQKQIISAQNRHLGDVTANLEKLTVQNKLNIQKAGLVRFNPFADTGGNMSFAIALLNGDKTGIVISSLHSREGTRIYAKEVVKGESKSHLTDEERQAIEEAK